jgi:hypothetical protein
LQGLKLIQNKGKHSSSGEERDREKEIQPILGEERQRWVMVCPDLPSLLSLVLLLFSWGKAQKGDGCYGWEDMASRVREV